MTEPENDVPNDGRVADAIDGNWVDRLPFQSPKPFLRLSRADRPIGTWLLFIPCAWSALLAFVATDGNPQVLVWVLVVCALGSFLMRGAGCTWNDLTDRHLDAQVARTKSRPLPSGQVTPKQAFVWICIQALVAFALLLTLNANAVLLGIAALLPVAIYPFAKRFTWWPQAFLGIAFNWGALLGWVAVSGSLDWPAIVLYLGGIFWTLFYDTVYAHQDREDDALIGIKSTARLFGQRTHLALFVFLVATVLLLTLAVCLALPAKTHELSMFVTLIAVWGLGYQLYWQMARLDINDPELCWQLFLSTRFGGIILILGLVIAAILRFTLSVS
ncbi:MAG: 4-hydroxybenzoate octaprenyltransferase [Pseudomonadota bacterium]